MADEPRCQSCGHTCVGSVITKCSDLFSFRWPGGKEHNGYVLPHELIGLRDNGASSDYVQFQYCLVCGQIQGKWPVKGAVKYLREYAPVKFHEVYLTWDSGSWDTIYFKARTVQQVEKALEDCEFHKVVSYKIHTTDDGWNWPEDDDTIVVRDLG